MGPDPIIMHIKDALHDIIKKHGPLLGIQLICVAIIWLIAGPGPGICAGFILGAVIFGFLKEAKEPGSLLTYFGNWKRALAATASMTIISIVFGIPLLALAIIFTPSAAEDWNKALADYGLTGQDMLFRIFLIGGLASGIFAFTHLICTRIGFKMVAVIKGVHIRKS